MFRQNSKATPVPVPVDPGILRHLVSPGDLSFEKFYELADGAFVEQVPAGTVLFEEGDHDGHLIYVLAGKVHLAGPKGVETIVGGEDSAKSPIAPQQPRACTAACVTEVSIARFDYRKFESLEGPVQTGIDVAHLSEDEDEELDLGETWMARVSQSDRFKYIPPVSLQEIFMRLEERPVSKGHTIISQDEEADFYYILKRGRCAVTRRNSNGAQVALCYLSSGDGFGEEAMLTRNVQNATVTMETDGAVLRLSRSDFVKLLSDPLIARVNLDEANAMVAEGGTFVDVRPQVDEDSPSLAGAQHTPLYMLRIAMERMKRDGSYVCYCDDSRISAAAVFLLRSSGFDAFLLDGGLEKNS